LHSLCTPNRMLALQRRHAPAAISIRARPGRSTSFPLTNATLWLTRCLESQVYPARPRFRHGAKLGFPFFRIKIAFLQGYGFFLDTNEQCDGHRRSNVTAHGGKLCLWRHVIAIANRRLGQSSGSSGWLSSLASSIPLFSSFAS
jgi:hypothetical protein